MSKQESRLSIAIESQEAVRNAKAVQKELKSIQETGNFAAKSVDGTSKSINQFSQEGAKGAFSAKVLAGQISTVGTQSKTASDGLGKVTQSTNASATSMNAASTAAQALASRIAAIVTVGSAITKMDAFAGFENRLKLVTTSQTELNQAMNDTFRIAQNSRQEWDSVVQVYQRFSENAKTLGIDMKKTAELTETVSKAVAISGASSASAEAALTQFGQALASGVLRGEELNSVMEQTPGLSKAIAQGMGITIGQLRAVAAEGKITTDVLVDALTKSKDSVDELFGKTSMTIGQSMTYLNNEVTKFTGEAGKSSGAATALAESIKLLGDNLGLVTNIAMIGGAYWLGTYIPAIYKSVTAGYAKVQSTVAEMRAEQLANEITVQRSARIAHLTAIELANAQAQAARMSGIAKVAFVEKTLIPLEQANTAAIAANTVVQDANNKSKLLGVGIGSRLIGVLGGPVGLGLTVAGVAASMLLMSGNTKTANEDLKDQSKYAEMANEELAKLEGNKKKYATEILTAELELQNNQLKAAQKEFEALTETIANSSKGNIEAERIWAQVKAGVMTAEQAVAEYNKLSFITSPQMTQLENGQVKIKGLEDKVENANIRLHQVKPASEVAAGGIDKVGNAAANTELKVAGMSAAYQQFLDKAKSNAAKEMWVSAYAERTGMTTDQARFFWDAKQADQGKVITQERANQLDLLYKQGQASKDLDESRQKAAQTQAKADKDANRAAEKQLKTIQASAKVKENAIKYDFAYYEKLNNLPSGMLTTLHAIESGNSGKTNQVNKKTGATGGFQFLDGTAKQYGLKDRTNMRESARAAGEYMRDMLKIFNGNTEKAVRAYHAGATNVKNGTKIGKYNNDYWDKYQRYQGGLSGFSGTKSDFAKQTDIENKLLEDQAKLRKSLELEVATEVDRILDKHKAKLEEVTKANFSEEKTREVVARLTEITQNEIDITEFSLRKKYDDYSDYLKSEEELLVKSYQERAFYADYDLTLTEEQRKKAVANLQDQMDRELLVIRQNQQEKQSIYDQEVANRRREIDDKMVRNTMGGNDYQRYSLVRDQEDEYKANEKWFTDEQASIDKLYRAREISQEEHFRRMEQAKIDHVDKDLATSLEYQKKEADVLASQKAAQLQLWSSLVSQSQTTWSQMTQSVKDGAGEQSVSYKTMFAMQQAFSIASTLIATHLAAMQVTADGANPTLFGKVTAHSAILAMGYAQAGLIASQAIAGFATGGQITGKGSGTSDDIPIMASNGEYMIREFAASKLGLQTLNYINKTGELPYQKFQEQLLLQQGSSKPVTQGFSTGGLIGSPQQSSPMVERQQLVAMRESNVVEKGGEPSVTIHQSVSFDTSGGEAQINTSGQKAIAESLNSAMNNWARLESMQGGVLFNAIKRIR